jgi:uncharacterized lipoprotein YmbA
MIRSFLASILTLGLLAGCSATTERYILEPSKSDLRLRVSAASVMVRSVSLPTYAAAEEIPVQGADGVIRASAAGLWADDPERAMTLVLARQLNAMTTAVVAPEPWPLDGVPDVAIDIRVEQMLATNTGMLRLSGLYFIGGAGIEVAPNVRTFEIEAPVRGESFGALATAQSEALRLLAERITRDLAR